MTKKKTTAKKTTKKTTTTKKITKAQVKREMRKMHKAVQEFKKAKPMNPTKTVMAYIKDQWKKENRQPRRFA